MAFRTKQTQEDREEDEVASSTSSSEAEREESDDDDDDDDDDDEKDSSSEAGSDEQMDGDVNLSDDDDDEDDDGSDDVEEGESDNEELEDEDSPVNGKKINIDNGNIHNGGGEQCTFDLTNLLAFNTHQINVAELYRAGGGNAKLNREDWYGTSPTIEATTGGPLPGVVNESLLLVKAAEGTTQLLRELWKLPTEKTDVGSLARLPTAAETQLPRSLPPPPPKQPSKWEQFALKRGIAPQSKRSRKVYDESTGEWKHLTGSLSNRANAGPESWPIIEVKKNDDPNRDPWEKLREEKKARVGKNTVGRMRNAERAGTLEKGSANRLTKDNARLEKQRAMMREKDRKRGLVAPAGVPMDMAKKSGGEDGGAGGGVAVRRGKPSTTLALRATQVSTASLGRFDRLREGEPERRGQLSKSINGKKRKQLDADINGVGSGGGTNKKFLQSEAQKSADILNRVMNGSSSKERERDVRKGKFAKGETAYDYEFDDGLGGGSFRKKKGRAGAGKMKKVTKKRIK